LIAFEIKKGLLR